MKRILLSLLAISFSFTSLLAQEIDSDGFALRINCGGAQTEYLSDIYLDDAGYNTGNILNRPQTGLSEPYRSFRYSKSQQLTYSLPVPNGDYQVNLHFAELWFGATNGGSGGKGMRVFDVLLQNNLVEDNLDIYDEVGAETILVKNHLATVENGVLKIDFDSRDVVGGQRHPVINAIEILALNDANDFRPFITTWETRIGGPEDAEVTLPVRPNSVYDYNVDWGDGNVDSGINGEITHIYDVPGSYTVSITGVYPRIAFGGDEKLIEINQWGDIEWSSFENAFENGRDLDIKATDAPNLRQVNSMAFAFSNAQNISGDLNHWNVSNVIDMNHMFAGSNTNLKISNWDVSQVQNMSSMFASGKVNYDISLWNVSSVSDFSYMFASELGSASDLSGWNVDSAVNMRSMFSESYFDMGNIENWDVSNVTNMASMFLNSTMFDFNLSQWNVGNVTDMRGIFSGESVGLSTDNYDNTLIGWSNLSNLKENVILGANVYYCRSAEAREKLIQLYNWNLADNGILEGCEEEPLNFQLRINAGGGATDDFLQDQNFSTGSTLDRPQTGLQDPFKSFRFSRTQEMSYDIPLQDGQYTVKLHFAELWFGATGGGSGEIGNRVFDVRIENELVEDNLDVYAQVGAQTVLTKTYQVDVADGNLNIYFSSLDEDGGSRHPIINAIEILGHQEAYEELVLETIPNLTTNISSVIDRDVIVSGGNQDEDFNFSISGQPTGISINPLTGKIQGTVSETAISGGVNKNGIHHVTVTVSQEGSTPQSTTFTWVIASPLCDWTELSDTNFKRFEGVSQKIGDKLYVFGGFNPSFKVVDDVEIYDTTNGEWSIGSKMPVALTHTAAVATGDEIWLVGGFAGDNPGVATDVVQIYNVLTDTWRMGPSLPREMGSGAVAMVEDKIYHFGGLLPDRQTVVGDHMVLDLTNESAGWSNLAPMPEARNHHSGIALNGIIYAIGGQVGHDGPRYDTRFVHAYNPATDEWTRMTDLARPRSHFKAGTTWHNGKIIITGGVENAKVIGDISQYDPSTNHWDEICRLPGNGLEEAAVQAFDNRLIVAGGRPITHSTTIIDQTISLPLSDNLMFAPVASAGEDFEVSTSDISLEAVGNDPDGGNVVYQWSQVSGPNTVNFDNVRSAQPNISGLTLGTYEFRVTVMDDENEIDFDIVAVEVTAESNFTLNINAGGTSTTYNDETFADDQYFDTGSTLDRPQTGLPEPYKTFRFSRSQQMGYTIPVPDGEYTVKLHFAELWFGATGGGAGGAGLRVFDVSLESNLVENDLDIYAEVGAEAMLVKTHTVNVTDGELNIDFDSRDEVGGQRHPVINGIEIIKRTSGSLASKKTSIEKYTENNLITLYPNQVSDVATLSFEELPSIRQVFIFDLMGRLVESYSPNHLENQNKLKIDVSGYQQGTYFVKLIDSSGQDYQKQMLVKRP